MGNLTFQDLAQKMSKTLVYECLGRKKSQLALSEIRPEVAEKWEGSESYHRRNHAQIVAHSVRNSQKFFKFRHKFGFQRLT